MAAFPGTLFGTSYRVCAGEHIRPRRNTGQIVMDDQLPTKASDFPDEHPESRRDAAPTAGPVSSADDEAQPAHDFWDPEFWSGPEQVLLAVVGLGAPVLLWVTLVDHLPEAWIDWAEIPILGLGDLIAALLFMYVYGSARALLRYTLNGRPTPMDSVLPSSRATRLDDEPPRDPEPGETAPLRLHHADSGVVPPPVLVERLTHWSMLALGVPFAVISCWLTVWAFTEGQRLLSLACVPGVLLGGVLVYWWARMQLVAGPDGILIRREFRGHHIRWSDLDYIEFHELPANDEFNGATIIVFVTREQVRISEPNLSGSTEPGGYLYTLAQDLLAMRDAYAPAPGHP